MKIAGNAKLVVGGPIIPCVSSTESHSDADYDCAPFVEIYTKGDFKKGTGTLHWKSRNLDSMSITPDPATEPGASSAYFVEMNEHGSCAISPVTNTTYTITGTKNVGGKAITVKDS